MSVKRFKMARGLYFLDSSSSKHSSEFIKARSDRVYEEVKESFDPSAVTVVEDSSEESDDESD